MNAPKTKTASRLPRLSGGVVGLTIVLALGAANLIGFGLEFLLTEDGFAKYRTVTGPYELVLIPATLAAILAGWGMRWLFGHRGDYYEHAAGDVSGEGRDD
ncbi:hypothetical protein L2D00_02510 [Hyphomonadaceae bacterium BL14]|nr:hypothetical protein L2D00_02510 [Hyphomonadaceae bacterium BL14]